ncbi:hypothetical protein ACIOHS_05230 [Streptomyces sp. NPDC088253]|uniref:hypothetical protein n=1 Tax=Streptomyces sp. NPDC088253 TaxID=3365846 RepID=UPI0038076EFA
MSPREGSHDSASADRAQPFQLVHNGDGTVGPPVSATGTYVTAEEAGASAPITHRTAIGPREKCTLITGRYGPERPACLAHRPVQTGAAGTSRSATGPGAIRNIRDVP